MGRNTKQKEILTETLKGINSFFNAEELWKRAKKKDSNMGIATVYRFLNHAKLNGTVYTYLCERKQIYSKGKKSHCHFICEKTGKITHFDVDSIDFLKNKIPGEITSFQLEVKGICKDCK